MQVLTDEIRHAGYYGALANAPVLPASLPDPCDQTLSTVQGSVGVPLQGYAGASTAPVTCLAGAPGYKPNTGVIVIRRVDTSISLAAPTAGFFNIQTSGCAGDGARYIVNTPTLANFTLHSNGSPGCTPLTSAPTAKIAPVYFRIYFVSTCSGDDCSVAGANSVPTLKRIDLTPTGATTITPIVDGIENLQFEYGIDTSGDGAPDVYTNTTAHSATVPSDINEWQNVMAVRIYLLARNLDTSGSFIDTKTYALGPAASADATPGGSFRRHAYTELVRLNNPAGRRE
jgi:hypothetical protein